MIKEQGRVDILVNNAGFWTTSLLAEHDAEDAKTVRVTTVCSAYELHAAMAVRTCMVRTELLYLEDTLQTPPQSSLQSFLSLCYLTTFMLHCLQS